MFTEAVKNESKQNYVANFKALVNKQTPFTVYSPLESIDHMPLL